MNTDKVGKRKRRSDEQKKRRQEFEKGPWPCSYCECTPYTSIAGFRDYMILVHKKNCSWTGVVCDFTDKETEERIGDHIRSQRAKKRRRTTKPTASAEPESSPSTSLGLADQETTTQPGTCLLSTAANNQPELQDVGSEASIIRLLAGSPSASDVVNELEIYGDAAWTPDPAMLDGWNALLGLDTGAGVTDPQPAVSASDNVEGSANIDQGKVSLHEVGIMTDVIKSDFAVQVVPSYDVGVQTVTTSHNSATQTPRSGGRYLPEGISLKRVLEELQESPDLSLGEIRGRLLAELQQQPSNEAINLLNFMLCAMMQTHKDLISAVCNAQAEAGRLQERDPQAARVRLENTMVKIRCEMNRHLGDASHAAAASVAVEIERQPLTQLIEDTDYEVISDVD